MKDLLSLIAGKTMALVGHKLDEVPLAPKNCSPVCRLPLNAIVQGFDAVRDSDLKTLVADFEGLNWAERLVHYEGAFAAAFCLDLTQPLEYSRAGLLAELAPKHISGLALGAGHAISHMNGAAEISPEVANHYLVWMAMDAYGWHKGYFQWSDSVHKLNIPKGLSPVALKAFDQGLGRGLYFIADSDAVAIEQLIERFPLARRGDLWRGVGLMTSFWGAEDERHMKRLLKASRQFRPFFQQGVAHGISLRVEIDEVPDHSRAASELICGASPSEVAAVASSSMNMFFGKRFDSKSMIDYQNMIVSFFDSGSSDKYLSQQVELI